MKINKVIVVFSLVILFTSCENFLTPDNRTAANQTADQYFSENPADLRVYTYSLLKPIFKRVDVFEEGVDLYMASNKKSGTQFDQYTITPENDDVKSFYADLYACINMANATIFYDKDMAYTAEMKFVRSYCYYVLSQQFGAVPYVTEYINNSNREYPRTELATLYQNLITELEGIADDESLPATNTQGSASKRAVAALLAEVYLAAGWDLGTSINDAVTGTYTVNDNTNFTKALTWATTAIDGQALSMSFEEKWSPKNECNDEVIFAVQYSRSGWPGELKTGGHGLQNTFGSYYGDCTSTGEKYVDGLHACNPKSAYLWDAADARFEATFMTTMFNSVKGGWGKEGYYAYYNADAAALDTLPIAVKYFSGNATAAAVSTFKSENAARLQKGENINDVYVIQLTYPNVSCNGNSEAYSLFVNSGSTSGMFAAPVVKKFDDPSSDAIAVNKTNGYRDIVLMHLSEIYLVAAEAALMAGNESQAETYVNAVRTRSGAASVSFSSYKSPYADCYAAFDNQPIDLILDERARELYAEGHRWMDLRRTRQLVRYNQLFNEELASNALSAMSDNSGNVKWYRPIPQAEINANNSLTGADQNPGY